MARQPLSILFNPLYAKHVSAATRCTEKTEQLGPVDVERQIVDRQHVAEPARYILDSNNG